MSRRSRISEPKKAEHILAPELWHLVVSHLRTSSPSSSSPTYDRKALVQLSLVSSHLLLIARPYYYTDIKLTAWIHFSTLHLLAQNVELASCVKRFKVLMPPVPRWSHQYGLPWPAVTNQVVLDAIFNMSSLEELDMTGSVFSFQSEQKRFLNNFRYREKPLKTLSFFEAPSTQLFPGETFDLPGLTSLNWASYRDRECI
jgi:hypothetical protein